MKRSDASLLAACIFSSLSLCHNPSTTFAQCTVEKLGELAPGQELLPAIFYMIEGDGIAYMPARTDDSSSEGFIVSNGHPSGTLYSVFQGTIWDEDDPVVLGQNVFFPGIVGDSGLELWRMSPGGAYTLLDDLVPSDESELNSRYVENLCTDGTFLYFIGNLEGATTSSNRTIYRSSGQPGSMTSVFQYDPEDPVPQVFELTTFNGKVMYTGGDSENVFSTNLWTLDGSNPVLLSADIPANDVRFAPAESVLYFTSGTQLWRTDGTPGGTFRVSPDTVTNVVFNRWPRNWLAAGNGLYHTRSGELWYTSGAPNSYALVESQSYTLYAEFNGAALLGRGNPSRYYVSSGGLTPALMTDLMGLQPDFFGSAPSINSASPINYRGQGLLLPGNTLYLTDLSARPPDLLCVYDSSDNTRLQGAYSEIDGSLVGVISRFEAAQPFGRVDIPTMSTPTATPTPIPTPSPTPTLTPVPTPGPFVLISPGNRETVTGLRVFFQWQPSEHAEDYLVNVVLSSGGLFMREVQGQTNLDAVLPDSIIEDQPHEWIVIARNASGLRTSSNALEFFKESELFEALQIILGEREPRPIGQYDTNGDGLFDSGDLLSQVLLLDR